MDDQAVPALLLTKGMPTRARVDGVRWVFFINAVHADDATVRISAHAGGGHQTHVVAQGDSVTLAGRTWHVDRVAFDKPEIVELSDRPGQVGEG